MPGNFRKDDLRIIKTHRALYCAMTKLLMRRNFNQITVNDLCEEAQISRATFYAHFEDKYSLLRQWLAELEVVKMKKEPSYEQIEKLVNHYINENKRLVRNILEYANDETSEIVHAFLISLLNMSLATREDGKTDPKATVLSVFCAGGLCELILWQVKNNFPAELKLVNEHIYGIIMQLLAL